LTEETGAHVGRRFLDVSGLPTFAFGHRDPLWWGVWMLIIVETMMFALLVTSYFYLRGNYSLWPPPGASQAPLWLTSSTLIALLLSAIPMAIAYRAAWDGRLRPIQLAFAGVTILSAVALALRGYEISRIGYNWNSHAYGSVAWALYFMHTLHLASGVVENGVMTVLLFRGPVEKKHMLDIRLGAYYWWFVVVSWVVIWGIVIGDDLLMR
jgi:cytochrome c oxidase subunit III